MCEHSQLRVFPFPSLPDLLPLKLIFFQRHRQGCYWRQTHPKRRWKEASRRRHSD